MFTTTPAAATIVNDRSMSRLAAAEQARIVRMSRRAAAEQPATVQPMRPRRLFRRRPTIAFDM